VTAPTEFAELRSGHLGVRVAGVDGLHQISDPVQRLRGLRDDAESGPWSQPGDIPFVLHHVKFLEVFRQSPNFNMAVSSNNDRMVAFLRQSHH